MEPQRSPHAAGQGCHSPSEELEHWEQLNPRLIHISSNSLTHSVRMPPSQGPDSKRDRTFKLLQDKLEEKTLP